MPLIWLAFFLSGIAGLSYEVTWSRFLVDLFGSSTPAIAATISIYFLGLALGSWIGARVFQGAGAVALARYALLELAIGITAALVPLCLGGLTSLMLRFEGTGGLGWSLLVSTAVLIVPTTLLGATFPAMSAVVRRFQAGRSTGSSTGYFYGLNTLGAVVGSLAVAFILLPAVGRLWCSYALVLVNLTIAAATGLLYLRLRRQTDDFRYPEPGHSVPDPGPREPSIGLGAASVVAAATGFLGIAVEVLWVRALALSFPATTEVLALVLAAYLLGIGLGALAVGRLQHGAAAPTTLAALYLAIPLACALTSFLMPHLLPWSISFILAGDLPGWDAYLAWVGAAAVGVMLPATLAMGAALPVLIGAASPRQAGAPRVAGGLYALNTLGGVLGSLAATFVLMPWIGVSACLAICLAGYLCVALLVAVRSGARRWIQLGAAALLAASLAAVPAGLFPEVNPLKHQEGKSLRFYRDAATSTVSIYQDARGDRSLWSNNLYALSETRPRTVALQYRIGVLSTHLHQAPRQALLVGFATGATLAAMSRDRRVERLACVELHELYFGLAPHFAAVNRGVTRDPRVSLVQADGRHFLSRPGPRYDLVVSDLFVPRNPGVATLYSAEHFAAVRRRLAPRGALVAWLPLWQLSPAEVGSIVRTFQQVFPVGQAVVDRSDATRSILGLVGREGGAAALSTDGLARVLGRALPAAMSAAFPGVATPPFPPPSSKPILLLDPPLLKRWAADHPLNTLDHPVIEHSSPATIFNQRFSTVPLSRKNLDFIGMLLGKGSTIRPPSNNNYKQQEGNIGQDSPGRGAHPQGAPLPR